ncbi:uncharacterized protein DUF4129 [Thermosporothrix hazakensis]|jgi:hypothetical protein|uniref:Uncharacterized protein DUF4129 n=2 Tax=Thermosporothrix TaxID=768650 RepID=A0A326U226_THEHA|nr:DUF4129 domain-containing protein [Thermosporothrix hazakensis]PZW24664.1 uncharacterized protein DUF4129 [Thermosporothrix hazakensis]BBH90352.1 hypothetical protein KTC_51030 [Thermosporothrix sp. COM3]GCE48388.1 hypothetical protein KTH_32570 [Thermosporothrix hazakensis]
MKGTNRTSERATPRFSIGEAFLPLMLIVMEACWIYALLLAANALFSAPLFEPLQSTWPLVLMGFLCAGPVSLLEKRRGLLPSLGLYSVGAALVTPGLSWTIIATVWAGAGDTTLLIAHLVLIFVVCLAILWHGRSLARGSLEPGDITEKFRRGILWLLGALGVIAATQKAAFLSPLFLTIVVFIASSLFAQSFSRVAFLRLSYQKSMFGDVARQDLTLLSMVSLFCLFLVVLAILIVSIIQPNLLTVLQRPLVWLYQGAIYVFALVFYPLVWLLSLVLPEYKSGQKHEPPIKQFRTLDHQSASPANSSLFFAILVAVTALIVALLLIRFLLALRKRKVTSELHESIWSWHLFFEQLRSLFRALLRKKTRAVAEAEQERYPMELEHEPTIRSIRELYRALLAWAERNGIKRRLDETPSEFERRLLDQLAVRGPELHQVTLAYIAARYGGRTFQAEEILRVREACLLLQQGKRKGQ